MQSSTYLKERQRFWAQRRDIRLIGSQNERGEKLYTPTLAENLFRPLSEAARAQFAAGDGGELGSNGKPGKMQAVHSSSALGVNVFDYWLTRGEIGLLVAALGVKAPSVQRVRFEVKWPIHKSFDKAPNIDVVIDCGADKDTNLIAIECKFNEAYDSRGHQGLRPQYPDLAESYWRDYPSLLTLAKSISPLDEQYQHLHPAQLIKHVLGLTQQQGRRGFTLVYLWYDVPGEDGVRHGREVERFGKIAEADGIRFAALTYQELIVRMAQRLGDEHRAYVDYLTERYL